MEEPNQKKGEGGLFPVEILLLRQSIAVCWSKEISLF